MKLLCAIIYKQFNKISSCPEADPVNIMIIVSVYCPKLIFTSFLALVVKLLEKAWVPMTQQIIDDWKQKMKKKEKREN